MMAELDELLAFRPGHLGWPIPPDLVDRFGVDGAVALLEKRKDRILLAEADPLRHGYEPRIWSTVQDHIDDLRKSFPKGVIKLIIWGGNRSSKTRFAANYVNRDCAETSGRRWWCCDSTEAMSRSNQMRLIYEQFPPEWKNLKRSAVTDVSYNLSDGFPKNRLVTPNRSEIEFKFYSMDVANLPGPELDGIWADELIPLVWIETLVYRLINRNGLLLVTFTPELGWNETFGYFYEGAQVIEEQEAPLLPKYGENGELVGHKMRPRVMQCADPTARIVFFWTQDNPYGNYPALRQQLKSKGEEEISIRAYGLCTKSFSLAFPMFNRNAHVITHSQFVAIAKQRDAERYHLVDPCDGRMWFMIWVLVPRPNKWIIYREFPSHGHTGAYIQGVGAPGPWAVSGAAADGVKGPAQDSKGFGLERYVEEIVYQEKGENILARYIDSRYATSPRLGAETVTSLIEQINEVAIGHGVEFHPMVPGKGRIISLDKNDGSIDLINSALYYDVETELGKFSPTLGRLNEPQLLVTEQCPNVIYALEHFTGQDGQKGACKDPIDCIRGLFLTSVNYVGTTQYCFQGGGVPR